MQPCSWTVENRTDLELLGYIPEFLFEDDPRPAKEQFAERYAHGGGWNPSQDKHWNFLPDTGKLFWSDDEEVENFKAIAYTWLHRNEVIIVYNHAIVVIVQKDKSYEIGRID